MTQRLPWGPALHGRHDCSLAAFSLRLDSGPRRVIWAWACFVHKGVPRVRAVPGIEEVSAKMPVEFPVGILGRIAVSLDTSLPCHLVVKLT